MPEPWGADVHADLRVYFDADGKARFSASCPSANVVLYDVQAKIAELRSRAEALEAWLRAWSEQEDR